MSDIVFGCPSCSTTAGRSVCPIHRDRATRVSSEINISATGTYPAAMPEPLREALAFEVQRHMEGYGCTNVIVKVTSDAAPA